MIPPWSRPWNPVTRHHRIAHHRQPLRPPSDLIPVEHRSVPPRPSEPGRRPSTATIRAPAPAQVARQRDSETASRAWRGMPRPLPPGGQFPGLPAAPAIRWRPSNSSVCETAHSPGPRTGYRAGTLRPGLDLRTSSWPPITPRQPGTAVQAGRDQRCQLAIRGPTQSALTTVRMRRRSSVKDSRR